MPSTIPQINTAISAALTAAGIRNLEFFSDTFTPPVAMVVYHDGQRETFGDPGEWRHIFTVLVIVARSSDRAGLKTLEEMMSTTGTTSVRAALEADQTFGGKVSSSWVNHIGPPVALNVGGGTAPVAYITCPFSVEVLD